MSTSRTAVAVLVLTTLALGACATTDPTSAADPGPKPLRVGVTPTYPPMIFKLEQRIAGVEADLARRLGQELGRPIQFVELRWDEQIPALLDGTTDIIMSGMSITEARKIRISFTDPYFEGGLMAAMRTEDAFKYGSRDRMLNALVSIGVVEGTTGDIFVQRNFPNARVLQLSRAGDGAIELKRRSIDIFVHDAPAILWLVSENEADLVASNELLNREDLAWGVRRDDGQFTNQVNTVLRRWRSDGTLNGILKKWLPYWKPAG